MVDSAANSTPGYGNFDIDLDLLGGGVLWCDVMSWVVGWGGEVGVWWDVGRGTATETLINFDIDLDQFPVHFQALRHLTCCV